MKQAFLTTIECKDYGYLSTSGLTQWGTLP